MKNSEMVSGETLDDVARKQVQEKKEKEHKNSVEAGAGWILRMLEKNQEYGERIPLKRDRSFDVPQNVTELPSDISQLVRSAYLMERSQKGLHDLAEEISQQHPELRFSFTIDSDGRWIEYSVKKQNISVGDKVMWKPQGTDQWQEPKKIKSIHKDPKTQRKFAFVENETTGLPLNELVKVG